MAQFVLIVVILHFAWLCESIECLMVYAVIIFVVANWMEGKGN